MKETMGMILVAAYVVALVTLVAISWVVIADFIRERKERRIKRMAQKAQEETEGEA